MQGRVAAPWAGQADEGGPPALFVGAVVGDFENASLVEVQPAALALQSLK